jgi:hypothetical protein
MAGTVIETETTEEAGTQHLVQNEVTETHRASECRMLDGIQLLGMDTVMMALAGVGREIVPGMHLLQELSEVEVRRMVMGHWELMRGSGRRNRSGWIEIGILAQKRVGQLVMKKTIPWPSMKI